MKITIIIFAVVCSASARHHYDHQIKEHESHIHDHHDRRYHGPPAPLNHDGTVAETPEVKHAKAILFKAHSEAKSRLQYAPHYDEEDHQEHEHHYPSHNEHLDHSYSTKYHGPPAPLNHDGTVDETPEVKHAKAVHFQLYNQAVHRHRRSAHFEPAPLNPDGTVADTPEVHHAKAAFYAAHAAEYAHADHSWVEPEYKHEEPKYHHYVEPAQYHHSHYPSTKSTYQEPEHHAPHYQSKHFEPAPLNHDGTVADTDAILAAKAIHFSAHQEAHSRIAPLKYTYIQH